MDDRLMRHRLGYPEVVALAISNLGLGEVLHRGSVLHELSDDFDAHAPGNLDELRYGVLTARRAGATKNDVVNCLSRTALERWIKSTRS